MKPSYIEVFDSSKGVKDLERCYNEAYSTHAMRQCSEKKFRYYDQRLNENYRRLIHRLDPTKRHHLREAERALIRFRDAECKFEGFEMRGGTGEVVLVGVYLAEMTQRRAAELRRILDRIRQRAEG